LNDFEFVVSCIRTTFWCRRMVFGSDLVGDDVTRISGFVMNWNISESE